MGQCGKCGLRSGSLWPSPGGFELGPDLRHSALTTSRSNPVKAKSMTVPISVGSKHSENPWNSIPPPTLSSPVYGYIHTSLHTTLPLHDRDALPCPQSRIQLQMNVPHPMTCGLSLPLPLLDHQQLHGANCLICAVSCCMQTAHLRVTHRATESSLHVVPIKCTFALQ